MWVKRNTHEIFAYTFTIFYVHKHKYIFKKNDEEEKDTEIRENEVLNMLYKRHRYLEFMSWHGGIHFKTFLIYGIILVKCFGIIA